MVRRGVIHSSLALLLFCLIGRPGAAQQCPQFETLLTIAGVAGGTQNSPDQATLSAGGCVTLRVIVTRQSGATITSTDVTTSPNTRFFTDPARGSFSGPNGSVFCVSTAECNRQFPVYVRYTDPCTGTTETDTVHITVRPCITVVSPAFGSCPTAPVTATAAAGQCAAPVTFPNLGVTGTPTPTLTCTAPIGPGGSIVSVSSGSSFPVGSTTVTCTATNEGGTATCTFTVTVLPPTLSVTCPGTQNLTGCTATLPGNLSFTVSNACGTVTLRFGVSGVTTGSSLTLAQLLALAFNPGTSTVTVTATTSTGQTATCSFSVVVTRPALSVTCPPTQNLTGSAANCTATLPGNTSFTVNNACGTVTLSFGVTGVTTGSNLTLAQLLALAFNAGPSTVTATATTSTGQTATCSFSVVVSPATTLAVMCPGNQTLTGSSSNCTATLPSGLTFPTTGACGAVTLRFSVSGATTASNLTQAQLAALAFNAGTSTVTAAATTAAGQTATCSFTVTVRPPAPTITCPPSFTVCVPAGSCTASVTISPTVTPPCATTTTIVATLPGGGTVTVPAGTALTLPFGLTTITATATNVSGTATCTTNVLVLPAGQIEISATVAGATGAIGTPTSDQVTVHVGGTITVAVTISTPGCSGFNAVQAGLVSFGVGTDLNVGSFSGNVFTAGAGAANRQFPIYARFTNPCTGLTYTDTIHVTVRP